jgi:hypothetical protein
MSLTADQQKLWRELHPEPVVGDLPQDRIGGFIYACTFEGLGEPTGADVREQIAADQRDAGGDP